jgi:hypothetical protein
MRAAAGAPVIFDGRNLYDPEKMRELGFRVRHDRPADGAGRRNRLTDAHPHHRRGRLPRLAPLRPLPRGGHEVVGMDNFITGNPTTSRT